jgi:hypothetical protein
MKHSHGTRRMGLRIVGLLSILLLLTACGKPNHDEIAGPPELKANAADLKQTVVTPHLEEPIKAGTNVLWCGTMQVAWNEMCGFMKADVTLDGNPPAAAVLNKKSVTKDALDPTTYVALADTGANDVLGQIRKELADKFDGAAAPQLLPNAVAPETIIAYAYLFVDMPFAHTFERLPRPLQFQGVEVMAFGYEGVIKNSTHDGKAKNQIKLHDAKDKDNFILELTTKRENHHLILAKIPPAETLAETINAVRARLKDDPDHGSASRMIIPVLNFDLLREYDELKKNVTTAGFTKYAVEQALQSIRFRLDERGALLKSEGIVWASKCAVEPINYIFDKPFLIMLQYKDAKQPYFALWVDNSELLVKAKEE